MTRPVTVEDVKPRTVIDVVGADHRAAQLLDEIVLLVGTLGRAEEGQRIGPALPHDLGELVSDQVEGFIPGGLDELAVLADQRRREPLGVLDIIPPKASLHAGNAVVGRPAPVGGHLGDLAIVYV